MSYLYIVGICSILNVCCDLPTYSYTLFIFICYRYLRLNNYKIVASRIVVHPDDEFFRNEATTLKTIIYGENRFFFSRRTVARVKFNFK